MSNSIFRGPWGNPHLKPGRYPATVKGIEFVEYDNESRAMLELTFDLDACDRQMKTRIYLTREYGTRGKQRLWYLCRALGVEDYQVIEEPEMVVGRKLVLEINTVNPSLANHGQPYSDVHRFLPVDEESEESESNCATNEVR